MAGTPHQLCDDGRVRAGSYQSYVGPRTILLPKRRLALNQVALCDFAHFEGEASQAVSGKAVDLPV
jgi:hypothetical protein